MAVRAGRILPIPRTIGSFIMLVTALSFIAGFLRNELALTLLGTIFLTLLVCCFLGVFFTGVVYGRKGQSLSMTISAGIVDVGRDGELLIKTPGGSAPGRNYFRRLPAILIRCELCLETRDGRVIRHYADPGNENYSRFEVKERGAYYGESDRFMIMDAPGFFRLSFPVSQSSGARLLAVPSPSEELISLSLKSGGTEHRNEPHYRKSDELIDHRPYVPGDDPRRINWKLFSHAPLGDLFVREGEPEPPPHSRLLILVDTEADFSLYTLEEARLAVDLLCETALSAALEFSGRGMDILISHNGGLAPGAGSAPLNAAELSAALALPAAIQWPRPSSRGGNGIPRMADLSKADLPPAPMDMAVLIIALPRTGPDTSALDNFLKKRSVSAGTDIVFVYSADGRMGGARRVEKLGEAAETCAALYNRRSGVHAGSLAVSALQDHISGSGA